MDTRLVWSLCVPVVIIYTLGARALITLYIDNPTLLALGAGTVFLYICAAFYFVLSMKLVTDGILRGAGLMKEFVTATTWDLILRVVLVKVLARPFGYLGDLTNRMDARYEFVDTVLSNKICDIK